MDRIAFRKPHKSSLFPTQCKFIDFIAGNNDALDQIYFVLNPYKIKQEEHKKFDLEGFTKSLGFSSNHEELISEGIIRNFTSINEVQDRKKWHMI